MTFTNRFYVIFSGLAAIAAWALLYLALVWGGAVGNSGTFVQVGVTLVVVWVLSIIMHTVGKVKGWWNS